MDALLAYLRIVWDWPLFTVDQSTVTPGKLAIALLVFLGGFVFARMVSRYFAGRLLVRLKVDRGPASAIQTLIYYLLLVAVAMIALQLAEVPLTVFTIFGGALALGIGFGSQNLVNNFISGLILLIERPLKVGDLIEVEGKTGTVRRIGVRATSLKTFDGSDCLLPNSLLLENPVTNWHHDDDQVRVRVGVGVAYGSPTDAVRDLLLRAAADHADVLAEPPPAVLFQAFGDNALVFDLLAWCRPPNAFERRRLESDLRFAIDAACRASGVVIAFPQCDVHIDGAEPLKVEVVK